MDAENLMQKDTYTKQEVIKMLQDMQVEATKCQGFVIGHVTEIPGASLRIYP